MEGWREKKPLREGAKLHVGRRPHRVVLTLSEAADVIHLTPEEAFKLARALDRQARDAGPIIMPGDLGPAPPARVLGRIEPR